MFGKPQSIYLDRHSTYKVNAKGAIDDDRMRSQFERAMAELDVRVIHANSPQAKGRIENLFGTLQDRLVKELRLAGVSDIDAANRFLEEVFLPDFNRRFRVEPAQPADLHRPLQADDDLAAILSVQSERYVNQDFTIRFKGQWLQLQKVQPTLVLPKQRVTLEERLDGSLHVRLSKHYLQFEQLATRPEPAKHQATALTSNTGDRPEKQATAPAEGHPWRRFSYGHARTPAAQAKV